MKIYADICYYLESAIKSLYMMYHQDIEDIRQDCMVMFLNKINYINIANTRCVKDYFFILFKRLLLTLIKRYDRNKFDMEYIGYMTSILDDEEEI
jgi:hypothetical protein